MERRGAIGEARTASADGRRHPSPWRRVCHYRRQLAVLPRRAGLLGAAPSPLPPPLPPPRSRIAGGGSFYAASPPGAVPLRREPHSAERQ